MNFNSADVAWSNLVVVVDGRPVIGIRGLKYGKKQEKEYLHAAGNDPHGIQRGNITYEGEIKLLKIEYDKLLDSAKAQGYGDIMGFIGDIVCTYTVTRQSPMTTDRIKRFEFTSFDKAMEQNTKFMEITLPIMFLGLEENV